MNQSSTTLNNLYYVPPRHLSLYRYRNRFLKNTKEICQYSTYKDCWDVSSAEDKEALLSDYVDYKLAETINESIVYVTYWPECYCHVYETLFNLHKYVEDESNRKVLLNIPSHFPNLIDLANHIFGDRLLNSSLFEQDRMYLFLETTIVPNFRGGNPYFFMWNDPRLVGKIQRYWENQDVPSHDRIFLTKTSQNPKDLLDNLCDIEKVLSDMGFTIVYPELESDSNLFNMIRNARVIVVGNGSSLCPLVTLQNYSARIFILNARRYLPKLRQPCRTQQEVERLLQEQPQLYLDDFEKSLWRPVVSRFNTTYLDSFENKITKEQLGMLLRDLSL